MTHDKINISPKLRSYKMQNRIYVLALSLIMLVAVCKFIATEALIKTQEDAAGVINLSGRQRMLSQRIALHSELYYRQDSAEERGRLEALLLNEVDEFHTNHIALIYGSEEKNIDRLDNPSIENIYMSGNPPLNTLMKNYIGSIRVLLGSEQGGETGARALDYILETGPNILLSKLDRVVELHERKAREDVEDIIYLQTVFLAITALVLILEGLFLFRPLSKKVKRQIDEIGMREEIIAKQLDELERFTFIAAHNLHEPLRAISGFADRLKNKLSGQMDTDTQNYLDYLLQSTMHMRELVEGLAAYARVCSYVPDKKMIESESVLDKVLRGFSYDIKEKEVTVNYNNLPEIYYDEKMLLWIFEQLLKNALNFSIQPHPVIEISCRNKESEFWEFCVKDSGSGIEENYRDKIFEMFQTLHTGKEKRGAGVGLTLVKKLVERGGGAVRLTSEDGEGSAFYFTLPMKKG